ncbi:unnamed protein product [Caenorhabditis auriculariae]|uniref:Uncharacterized protein n=1 Tax=Caenorhabditis auriculariae TaxID=2777116 RepID=A0A8S1HEV8_9PELO|nr:unnamed protein product [Caenorhabditis auriculariae]
MMRQSMRRRRRRRRRRRVNRVAVHLVQLLQTEDVASISSSSSQKWVWTLEGGGNCGNIEIGTLSLSPSRENEADQETGERSLDQQRNAQRPDDGNNRGAERRPTTTASRIPLRIDLENDVIRRYIKKKKHRWKISRTASKEELAAHRLTKRLMTSSKGFLELIGGGSDWLRIN